MRQMRELWERFVSGTEVDLHRLPAIIREAWIRSRNAGIDPALPYAPLDEIHEVPVVSREELNWQTCAEDVFSLLCGFFTESHQFHFFWWMIEDGCSRFAVAARLWRERRPFGQFLGGIGAKRRSAVVL
jgi:hypothetical protein